MHSRIKRHQQTSNIPAWQKRLTTQDYLEYLTSERISDARLKGRLVLVQGDFNRPIKHKTNPTPLETWMTVNQLTCPDYEHLQRMPGYHTRNSGGEKQDETSIDHSMHTPLPPDVLLEEVGVVNSEDRKQFSDHLPVWFRFVLTNPVRTVPARRPLTSPPRIELNLHEDKAVEEFQAKIKQSISNMDKKYRQLDVANKAIVCSPDDSGAALQLVLAHTVAAASTPKSAKINALIRQANQPRSKKKHGYSGELAVLVAYKSFYENLIRLAFPSGRRHMRCNWAATTYQSILASLLRKWTKHYRIQLESIDPWSVVHATPSPAHLQTLSFHQISLSRIGTAISDIKRMLHGRKRALMLTENNATQQERADLHSTGKLGMLIDQLTCNPTMELDLQTLPCPLAGQITDHYEIQRLVNAHLYRWHAVPTNLDPAAEKLAKDPDWYKTLYEYDPLVHQGMPLHPDSTIPVEYHDGLRKVCSRKASDETSKVLQDTIYSNISFADFDEALNALKTGSAPGPSQVTANMIKAWPQPTRMFVYKHMSNIWKSRTIPPWFKDKLMKLIPKSPDSEALDDMRPISLYEIIRKVWTTIVGKRINKVWHERGLLHGAQYGYKLDNGVQMALFTVINEIEGANVKQNSKFVTFWDIKRAFDSIPRYLQLLAWRRLGIPEDVAEWFVALDDEGAIFASTPLYNTHKSMTTPQEIQGGNQHMVSLTDDDQQESDLSFRAERGIGQGESASSLMWIALYDILLEWIDPANRFLHTGERNTYSNDDIDKTTMAAYADDLCTITGGMNRAYMQQIQAKWLSAICAFTGLVLHPKKIKPTILGPIPLHHLRALTVYDHNWQAIQVPLLPQLETYKYLGVHLDLRNKPAKAFNRLLQTATTSLAHLLRQPASPKIKIDYIRFKILPNILYTAVCSNWTLDQFRQLDLPFSQTYRKILCLPAKAPTALLYLPQSMTGIGLPRVSDLAQIRKWEWFQRCSAVKGAPGASIDEILSRVPDQNPSLLAENEEGDPLYRLACPEPDHWPTQALTARSLMEWAGESGLQLALRRFDTPEEIMHNRNNQNTITEMAQLLDLWPDPRRATEIEELTPLRFFATDGSFKAEPNGLADILTGESRLRNHGKGAGGIVFIPRNARAAIQGVQITSDEPEPGMNAFTWELLTQVVALQMTQYQPHYLPGFSDCTSAITRSNMALRSFVNPLAHTRGGLWASAAHVYADCDQPRRFYHIKAHPERDPARKANPTVRDKAIYMADAVAGYSIAEQGILPGHILPSRLGQHELPVVLHSLKLENILNEIIPLKQWHFRTSDEHATPVLNDLIDYQHQACQTAMTTNRDQWNEEERWASTALSFASKVHPPKDPSFWAAARRALIVFDWVGHGRNRSKQCALHPAQQAQVAKCPHCPCLIDDQAHCMLECTHLPFRALRNTAKTKQAVIAQRLCDKHSQDDDTQCFIQQLCHASWTPSPNISRIWLGTWSMHTLHQMLGQPADTPMTMRQRYAYIDIAKKLTAPLIDAYSAMININTRTPKHPPPHEVEALPLYDHHPQDTHTELHITDPEHPEYSEALADRIRELELTFVQDDTSTCYPGPSLHQASMTIRQNTYDICDAAALLVPETSVATPAPTVVGADGPF